MRVKTRKSVQTDNKVKMAKTQNPNPKHKRQRLLRKQEHMELIKKEHMDLNSQGRFNKMQVQLISTDNQS